MRGKRKMTQLDKLINFIDESNNIVFFGGAGVSTDSGIPDFRSKDGLYNQHDVKFDKYEPEYLLSKDCLKFDTKVFYEFYRQKLDTRSIEPNITHKVLAKLEEIGKVKAIVTQNIDGLHQKAGSKTVYEIHGTTLRNYCSECHKEYASDYIFNTTDSIPRCTCGGVVRPDVVLYGETLPDAEVKGAMDAIKSADMIIIAGTSLTVYPAASFVSYFEGNHVVIINNNTTKYNDYLDYKDDMFIQSSMGEIFSALSKHYNLGV